MPFDFGIQGSMTSSKDPVPAPIVTSLTKKFESETFEVLIISTTRLSASCEDLNSPVAKVAAELCPNTRQLPQK